RKGRNVHRKCKDNGWREKVTGKPVESEHRSARDLEAIRQRARAGARGGEARSRQNSERVANSQNDAPVAAVGVPLQTKACVGNIGVGNPKIARVEKIKEFSAEL